MERLKVGNADYAEIDMLQVSEPAPNLSALPLRTYYPS